jgi:Glycosyl transferase family 2
VSVKINLSLVIPAYNEGNRLASGLKELLSYVSPDDTEILVVDDGSTDDTLDVAQWELSSWPQSSVLSLGQNFGKGAAVKAGVTRARGAVIAFADADMATDPENLDSLVRALDDSHVAVGSRSHKASVVDRGGTHRTVMNRTFGMLVASMTRLPYTDTQCGFKAFRGPIAKLLFHGAQLQRFAFDVEVMDLAARLGLRTAEVPVRWTDVPGSHVHPFRDSIQMLGDLARIRLSSRKAPPIQGVSFHDIPIESAEMTLRPHIRAVDLVIKWDEGTAVLFPCTPPTVSRRIMFRMLDELRHDNAEMLCVDFRSLYSSANVSDLPRVEFVV